jgi:ankyrin repeat protein
VAQILIKNGASADVRDIYGLTPLDVASKSENFEMSKVLTAKVEWSDDRPLSGGETPLDEPY